MTRRNEHWPALRAGLLTLVMLHGLLLGLPLPALNEEALARDRWQPLVQWVQRLTDDTEEATRVRILRGNEQLTSLHADLTWPIAWLYRGLDAGQTWNMFAGAQKRSFALRVEMRRADQDGFETLYAVHDPHARFEAERIEYRRVHAAYIVFDNGTPGAYFAMCRWVAKRVFFTHSDAVEVRVRMRRHDCLTRAERLEKPETGVWAHGYRLTRQQFEQDMRDLHD